MSKGIAAIRGGALYIIRNRRTSRLVREPLQPWSVFFLGRGRWKRWRNPQI